MTNRRRGPRRESSTSRGGWCHSRRAPPARGKVVARPRPPKVFSRRNIGSPRSEPAETLRVTANMWHILVARSALRARVHLRAFRRPALAPARRRMGAVRRRMRCPPELAPHTGPISGSLAKVSGSHLCSDVSQRNPELACHASR